MSDPAIVAHFKSLGCKPIGCDKHGLKWSPLDAARLIKPAINSGLYFETRVKNMTQDAENAIAITEEVESRLSKTIDSFIKTEAAFSERSKRISGSVRDSAAKMADGLAKMQKVANFDALERQVELLERAAKAMQVLSELDASGKLTKITQALR